MKITSQLSIFFRNKVFSRPASPFLERQEKRRSFFSQFLTPGDLCFDIGANRGDITEIFLDLGCKVVAVEPQSHCVEVLKGRFGHNKSFKIIPAAVGSKLGRADIHICEGADYISTLSTKWMKESSFAKDWKWNRSENVPLITLDYLLKEHGTPAFCKIDVEGWEIEVLCGLSTPIPLLSFEFTGKCFRPELIKCLEKLATIGNYRFNFSQGENWKLLMQRWESSTSLVESLDELKDSDFWGDIICIS